MEKKKDKYFVFLDQRDYQIVLIGLFSLWLFSHSKTEKDYRISKMKKNKSKYFVILDQRDYQIVSLNLMFESIQIISTLWFSEILFQTAGGKI